MMRDVLLFSGGLDSYIAYFYLNQPMALYCNMKHKYAQVELKCVKAMISDLDMNIVIDNNTFDFSAIEQEDAIIPNRNIHLALLATNYGDSIWMAACDGDYNKDKNPEIFYSTQEYLSILTQRNIRFGTPFWQQTKSDMIKWYLKNGYNEEGLHYTYSCFLGEDTHCGVCPSCLRRWIAFTNNNIQGKFRNNPIDWDKIPEYISRFIEGKNPIDTIGRKKEFFHALFKEGYNIPLTNVNWIEEVRDEYS